MCYKYKWGILIQKESTCKGVAIYICTSGCVQQREDFFLSSRNEYGVPLKMLKNDSRSMAKHCKYRVRQIENVDFFVILWLF